MPNLFNKYQQIVGFLNYMLALSLAFSLSFPGKIMKIFCTLWFISWVLEGRYFNKRNFKTDRSQIPVFLLAGFVIWQLISVFWSQNPSSTLEKTQRQIWFLLIVPVALFGVNQYYKTTTLLFSMIAGAIVSIFVYYTAMLYLTNYEYFVNGGKKELWQGISVNLFVDWNKFIKHHLYYCTILVISAFSLFFLRKKMEGRYGKYITYFALIVVNLLIVAMIFLTGSRISVIILAIMLIFSIYRVSTHKNRIIFATALASFSIILLLLTFKYHPRVSNLKSIDWEVVKTGKNWDAGVTEPRLLIWYSTFKQPADYILHGIGAGNSTDYLMNIYKSNNYPQKFLDRKFGVHNQYLIETIELGILGGIFMILFFLFFSMFYTGKAKRFAIYFSLLYGLSLMTEGMLGRVEGIIIMIFFSLFCIWLQNEENGITELEAKGN